MHMHVEIDMNVHDLTYGEVIVLFNIGNFVATDHDNIHYLVAIWHGL